MVLKIPSATSAQPYLGSYRILPSPWAQGWPQCNSWDPMNGHHPSAQVLFGASSVGRSGVTARGGLYLCPPPPPRILLPQRGHSRWAPGLCHVGSHSEAHPPAGLDKHLHTAPPDPWAGAPLHQYITYIVWLLLPLNNLRFLAPAWKYRTPRQSLLTWQTCHWVPHNSQGGTASSP